MKHLFGQSLNWRKQSRDRETRNQSAYPKHVWKDVRSFLSFPCDEVWTRVCGRAGAGGHDGKDAFSHIWGRHFDTNSHLESTRNIFMELCSRTPWLCLWSNPMNEHVPGGGILGQTGCSSQCGPFGPLINFMCDILRPHPVLCQYMLLKMGIFRHKPWHGT